MTDVIINGVRYVPAGSNVNIGVAVTTRNRHKVLTDTLGHIRKHTPGAPVFVVDDASDKPIEEADYRFDKNVGIARAKNKALELLWYAGVEHMFLFDDDAYPIADDWWKPYVDSPEPHLMAIYDKPKGATKRQVEVLYEDDDHVAYHATRGYMLYAHRSVVERVGGMNPEFGKWGWEHQSWSDRIHSAGLTTFRYADVKGSDRLLHSMDAEGEIKSNATDEAKRYSEGPGFELRMESRHSDEYIEFRDLDDAVITCLLTSQKDPQRNKPMSADASMLETWRKSLGSDLRAIVLHTDLNGELPDTETVKVGQHVNAYFERWIQYFRWLREHPEIGRVWLTDGTDVEMLRDPFVEMVPGVLYVGSETTTLRDEWMIAHHPDETLQMFMKANANSPLLNAGLLGGDRETVMAFCQRMGKLWFDDHIDFIYGWETRRLNDEKAGDMGAFNYVARTEFADIIDYGPHVNTVFRAEDRANKTAWWRHK